MHRGNAEAIRAARNVLTAQKRRELRRLRARRQDRLLGELRGNPRRFWSGYKADKQAPVGGFTMAELTTHWSALLGGEDRGALPDAGADGAGLIPEAQARARSARPADQSLALAHDSAASASSKPRLWAGDAGATLLEAWVRSIR